MTAREIQIGKKILDACHDLDGAQAHALTVHGLIGGLSFCTSAEFDGAFKILDERKFLIGVKTKFRGVLWNISDAGEAARLEM